MVISNVGIQKILIHEKCQKSKLFLSRLEKTVLEKFKKIEHF